MNNIANRIPRFPPVLHLHHHLIAWVWGSREFYGIPSSLSSTQKLREEESSTVFGQTPGYYHKQTDNNRLFNLTIIIHL